MTKNFRNRGVSKWGQQRNKESYCACFTPSKIEFFFYLWKREQHIRTKSQTMNKKKK